MSRIYLGSLLIIFGTLFLLDSMDMVRPSLAGEYLKLFGKYWPGLLVLLGLNITLAEKNPGLAEALKWLILLLVGIWVFSMFFVERNWII